MHYPLNKDRKSVRARKNLSKILNLNRKFKLEKDEGSPLWHVPELSSILAAFSHHVASLIALHAYACNKRQDKQKRHHKFTIYKQLKQRRKFSE